MRFESVDRRRATSERLPHQASMLGARFRRWPDWRCAWAGLIALSVVAAPAVCAVGPASAQNQVDLELVLAVDVSWSMDPEEQRLQRDGYVAAFRDPMVIKAIQSGLYGRIAVTYFEWAGPHIHFQVIPWTMIEGPSTARQFADRLAGRSISRHRMTSISSALQFAERQFANSPFRGRRRVIDVSGDGPNNSGPSPVTRTRDDLVGRGIVINGLPITLKSGLGDRFGWGQNLPDLDVYYASCVIGGPGSFVIPITTLKEFATATRQKLLLEISGRPLGPVVPVQYYGPGPGRGSGVAGYDCEIGERNWRRRFQDWDPN